MSDNPVLVSKKGHLTIICINRPQVMNALHPEAHRQLGKAFDDFSEDANARVAILTASGDKVFCAGNDLHYHQKHGADAIVEALEKVKGGFGGITNRFDCFKPIIAAINGAALGGGTEIALACDIIVAAEHAMFGLPEPRVGLFAGAGGLHRICRHIPYHWAMGYALTGRMISANEALEMGMVNEVVPLQDLMPAAQRWADEILQCAPVAVSASKQIIQTGMNHPLEKAMRQRYPLSEELLQSEDLEEGISAFLEKRKPQWKGR